MRARFRASPVLPSNVSGGPASDKLAFVRGIAKVEETSTLLPGKPCLKCLRMLGWPTRYVLSHAYIGLHGLHGEYSDKVYSYTRVLCHYGALMEEVL